MRKNRVILMTKPSAKFIGDTDMGSRKDSVEEVVRFLRPDASFAFALMHGVPYIGKRSVIEWAIEKTNRLPFQKSKQQSLWQRVQQIFKPRPLIWPCRNHEYEVLSLDGIEKLLTGDGTYTNPQVIQAKMNSEPDIENQIKRIDEKIRQLEKKNKIVVIYYRAKGIDPNISRLIQNFTRQNQSAGIAKRKMIIVRRKDSNNPIRHSIDKKIEMLVPFRESEVKEFLSNTLDEQLNKKALIQEIRKFCGEHPGLLSLLCGAFATANSSIILESIKGRRISTCIKTILETKDHRDEDVCIKTINELLEFLSAGAKLAALKNRKHDELKTYGLLYKDRVRTRGQKQTRQFPVKVFEYLQTRRKMKVPKVFISYSHDSREHADRVLALADRLRREGVDCILDQYEESPPEGWIQWMERQIKNADFVLMVCTETYYKRVMGEEEPGKGLGVKFEGNLIYLHIYQADSKNTCFIPILFSSDQAQYIPDTLKGATYYLVDTAEGYEKLYRKLTNQHKTPKPDIGKLRELPRRERIQTVPSAEIQPVGFEKEGISTLLSAFAENLPIGNAAVNMLKQGAEKRLNTLVEEFVNIENDPNLDQQERGDALKRKSGLICDWLKKNEEFFKPVFDVLYKHFSSYSQG